MRRAHDAERSVEGADGRAGKSPDRGLLILPELIAGFTHVRLVIYGAVMLACLYFMPQGIAGFFEGRLQERKRRERRLPAADAEALNASIARRQMPGGGEAMVKIADVRKVFGGIVALDNLTIEIEPGTIHSFIGPNGAGKTTLVNVLSGVYRPDGATLRDLGLGRVHETGHRKNDRAESSQVPIRRRERKIQRFKSHVSAQRFLSTYGPIYNLFNAQRHLISRRTLRTFRNNAVKEWKVVTVAV